MRKILITGGTTFVSRYIAEYYVAKGDEVYVINRNSKKQSKGVILIEANRHCLGNKLRHKYFDVVIDTAYNSNDVNSLLDALDQYKDYIMISSSAVYPEYIPQPFHEDSLLAKNKYWKQYGTDKIEAEKILQKRNPKAYIIRPPYLYGPMNNIYREAFVFDCAICSRKFYLPGNGDMKLQFFHINDLCRFIDILLCNRPDRHIFNVGNKQLISIRDWVNLCYSIVGNTPEFISVNNKINQRDYFSFYDYEYVLDVSHQYQYMTNVKPLDIGLKESLDWYLKNMNEVNKKPFIDFIDNHLI